MRVGKTRHSVLLGEKLSVLVKKLHYFALITAMYWCHAIDEEAVCRGVLLISVVKRLWL